MTQRTPWSEKSRLIREQYPDSVNLDWYEVFTQDPAVMGNLINDIMKLDQARSGKPGKRPSLEEGNTSAKLKRMQDLDYSEKMFTESFKDLVGERSVRAVASKTGLDKSYIHRLLNGTAVPTPETMKMIAESFDKHASFFIEYRVSYILGMLEKKLHDSPESSIVFYKKILGRSEKA
jgi:plasmid maintenance system antidote protein VapI